MPQTLVIFDLDGTLTVPVLDFDQIRQEMGLPSGRPILEELEDVDEDCRQAAMEVLFRHEKKAAEDSILQEGASDTIRQLRDDGFPVAILTRNARQWTRVVLEKHSIEVDAVHTREDGVIKPSPEPVRKLCERFGIQPEHSWIVGDHLFDLLSGKRAGGRAILFAGKDTPQHFAEQADHVVTSLTDVISIIAGIKGS